MITVPEETLCYGFINDPIGTHSSRTIMFKELRLLLSACPRPTSYEEFRTAVVEHNVLLKNTESNRKESFRRLRELYAIDESVILFRALRDLWSEDETVQPLLTLFCAAARDSILRATAATILSMPRNHQVTPKMIEITIAEYFPKRYNATTLATIGRNAVSSWQQSGHLQGRLTKIRASASSQPAAVAYALFLGHLCGARGDTLFQTLWARLLDVAEYTLREQTLQASRLGYLEYRHAGSVTEISFQHLLRPHEDQP